jgi:outer membrane immunogenic protein
MGRLRPGFVAVLLAAATAVATPAAAADLPVAPTYNPPAYRPAMYDWNGIYVGGEAGAGLMQDDFTATASTLEAAGTQTRDSPLAVVGGGQLGVNFEMAPLVVGFEGDWMLSDISGSQISPSIVGGSTARSTAASHWYVTATGRVGYAANDMLYYVKGGWAFMRVDYTEDVLTNAAASSSDIIADNRTGFTVGGGFEYALNESLSVRVEYDFLDFGTKNYVFNATTPAGAVLAAPFTIKSDTQLVTAGFDYRFDWMRRSPLAAGY